MWVWRSLGTPSRWIGKNDLTTGFDRIYRFVVDAWRFSRLAPWAHLRRNVFFFLFYTFHGPWRWHTWHFFLFSPMRLQLPGKMWFHGCSVGYTRFCNIHSGKRGIDAGKVISTTFFTLELLEESPVGYRLRPITEWKGHEPKRLCQSVVGEVSFINSQRCIRKLAM